MRKFILLVLILAMQLSSSAVGKTFAQSDSKNMTAAVAPTPTELRVQVKRWLKTVRDAGKLFKNEDFQQSADLIEEVQRGVLSTAQGADKKQIRLLKSVYLKLARAHKLLAGKGVKLAALPSLPEATTRDENSKISFVGQIAPIIVNKCGACHVNQTRGGFSAANFMALDQSGMITPAVPQQSRIVDVIASGEMPKGNLKVEPKELTLLKAWVAEGANFDGDDPNASLASYRPSVGRNPSSPTVELADMALTGKETVSFALDVAPILINRCAECHIAGNPRGNFDMTNLASLLRGGDSGAALVPGSSATSEIVLRLKGAERDVMPPSGKLEDNQIQKISKWIDEGARFESQDLSYALSVVAAKGLANSMDHEQLIEVRKLAARKMWRLAHGDLEFSETQTDNFIVLGTGSKARLAEIGTQAESLSRRVAAVLKSTFQEPFYKGNVALFVVDKRYDFSEFGKMVEKRQFPRSINSAWNVEGVEAYVVMLAPFSGDESSREVTLSRDLAAIHVAGWNPTIPHWFAEGMAYWTAMKMFKRDKTLIDLDSISMASAAKMRKPDDFITGKISADQAALVGYAAVRSLQSNSRSFKRLLKAVRAKEGFDQAFKQSFGLPPREFFARAALAR